MGHPVPGDEEAVAKLGTRGRGLWRFNDAGGRAG